MRSYGTSATRRSRVRRGPFATPRPPPGSSARRARGSRTSPRCSPITTATRSSSVARRGGRSAHARSRPPRSETSPWPANGRWRSTSPAPRPTWREPSRCARRATRGARDCSSAGRMPRISRGGCTRREPRSRRRATDTGSWGTPSQSGGRWSRRDPCSRTSVTRAAARRSTARSRSSRRSRPGPTWWRPTPSRWVSTSCSSATGVRRSRLRNVRLPWPRSCACPSRPARVGFSASHGHRSVSERASTTCGGRSAMCRRTPRAATSRSSTTTSQGPSGCTRAPRRRWRSFGTESHSPTGVGSARQAATWLPRASTTSSPPAVPQTRSRRRRDSAPSSRRAARSG